MQSDKFITIARIKALNILLLILCLSFFNIPASYGQKPQRPPPFQIGEKLSFSLRWNFVKAGSAHAEVLPPTVITGVHVNHFLLTARTTPFIDMIYKVRDRIDSYTDLNITHSLFYAKKQREGHYKRDVAVRFNYKKQLAHYEASRGKRLETIIHPGTFDPLATCYYFRMQDLAIGKILQAPISDGKRCVIGQAEVIGRETIRVPAGRFDSFLILPEIKHLGGVFKRSEAATLHIWISADHRHLPVQVKSKVKVGNFLAVLTEIESGR